MSTGRPIRKLGLLVGGGPAPGINGVISAVTIEAISGGTEVIGFQDGFKWLVQGRADRQRRLLIEEVRDIHLRGGSILGTSRTNPTKPPELMDKVIEVLRGLEIDALVTIGGDDTAYSASVLHRRSGGALRVAHVPKTIDNDLPLPESTPTFGFETARQVGTLVLRNLKEDARTTSRWYLIVSMGRAAGFLALGIGKAAAATLTIIPEEFRGRRLTLGELCDLIAGAVIKRVRRGRHYGIVVLAEGLIETIGKQGLADAVRELLGEDALEAMLSTGDLGRYGKIATDPHGHLRLGEIAFGQMTNDLCTKRLEELGLKATFIDKDLGYELRCADPIPFDAEYTRDLGYAAVKFLRSDAGTQQGAIISFVEGRMVPLEFEGMLNPQTGRMKTRRVNVDGEGYEAARRYMTRLERSDFDDPAALAALAEVVGLSPEQFRERFGYLT
jgi:6-phosphofructokinase 1